MGWKPSREGGGAMHGFSPGGKARFHQIRECPPENLQFYHEIAGFARLGGMFLDGGPAVT